MMAGVHEHLVDHLKWNGEGKLLDIGCGAAALTVRCAKAFPEARITAVDYWGVEWSYAKEQCERNARIEELQIRSLSGKVMLQNWIFRTERLMLQ